MTDSLIPLESLGGELSVQQEAELLAEVASGGAYLPYMQLFTTKSGPVTEGKIPGGHYGVVRDGNITDIGKEVNLILIAVRARAYEKTDGGQITVVFDKNDAEYIRIQDLQASGVQGCMAGPEFLVWIPSEKTFATYFCGSKTLKREARKLGRFLGGHAVSFRVHLIDNGKHKWHGPLVSACSVSLPSLPDSEELTEEVQKFKNPPKQAQGESASPDATDQVSR